MQDAGQLCLRLQHSDTSAKTVKQNIPAVCQIEYANAFEVRFKLKLHETQREPHNKDNKSKY